MLAHERYRATVQRLCTALGIRPEDVLNRGRVPKVALPAYHGAVFVLRVRERLSMPAIGRFLHRDHSSIWHAFRLARLRIAHDRRFAAVVAGEAMRQRWEESLGVNTVTAAQREAESRAAAEMAAQAAAEAFAAATFWCGQCEQRLTGEQVRACGGAWCCPAPLEAIADDDDGATGGERGCAATLRHGRQEALAA